MKRLGRGLQAILEDAEAGYLKDLPQNGINEIFIKDIIPNPYQPRKEFSEESITELANSIKEYGLLQPIIVIKDKKNNKYILVAGERRLRAFKKLGKDKIKSIIVDYTLEDLREYALIENIQREDLNPIEIALSLDDLIKKYGYSHEELAKKIGKSRSYVSNILRILNLPHNVIEKIKRGTISIGHAKVLVNLSQKDIENLVDEVEKNNLSVRELEKKVKKIKKRDNKDINLSKKLDNISNILKKIGLKSEVGKDFIKIKFKNDTDLEKLEKLLSVIN